MSATVLKFPQPKRKNNLDVPRYWCVPCDTDVFKIAGDGTVYCVNCTSRIKNVQAVPK